MLAMEYGTVGMGHKYACSIMSSETISESCGSRNNRVRTVRLVRPPNGPLPPPGLTYRHGPSLGFSIRGGREHGTGIFVSHVELGSEAHIQGLRMGDQIIRVNGFAVDDAVHKEVLQLISNHTHVTLKVRGVGMIPVKDKKSDGLSWQIITDIGSPSRGSPQLGDKLNDVRINIMVAPKSKLGCGICKGPDWKPGIFVQFTKEGGIAREAGLQPGDQLLYCNNVDFSDIPFNEAVSLMKSSRQLNLIVRKGAGSELFPGESSGYNSSASSVTGDQSPSWSESKRLSIVKEESLELGERLHYLDKIKNCTVNKWESWDDMEHEDKPLFKPTIINLSENGTTIQNNGDVPLLDEYQSQFGLYNILEQTSNNDQTSNEEEEIYASKPEIKTVVVEVHETKPKMENSHLPLAKSASTSSFSSLASKSSCASNVTNTSLSSAITLEIQRRQKSLVPQKCSIDEQIHKKKILKNIDEGRQNQHSKLMDEFKKAHQKMFKNGDDNCQEERLNNINKNNELSEKLSERLTDLQKSITDDVKRLTLSKPGTGPVPPPPPPPPQQNQVDSLRSTPSSSTPSTRSNTLKLNKPKQAPPVPVKYSSLSYLTQQQQNGGQKTNKPPPCPTPDYDTVSLASTASAPTSSQNDQVEMESLESFKLNNPSEVQPRPPSTYFQKRVQTNGCGTVRRSRPVSITIGEYPTMRRQPGKLDFLQNGQNGAETGKEMDLGNRLASELTQTLNRSNLKKRTESMENLLTTKTTERMGAVHITFSSNLSKKPFAKSTSDLTDDHVTKLEPPNGILKNATHKTLLAQKSITFGEMPTLIKDRPTGKT